MDTNLRDIARAIVRSSKIARNYLKHPPCYGKKKNTISSNMSKEDALLRHKASNRILAAQEL